jgi:hypothetical protein
MRADSTSEIGETEARLQYFLDGEKNNAWLRKGQQAARLLDRADKLKISAEKWPKSSK